MLLDEFDSRTQTPRGAIVDRVLVVDEPESARQLKEILARKGYSVSVANDGGQAHATFNIEKPDFVILELLLPGESGFEICERLKKLNKSTPIMALTEIDLDSSRNLAVRVGVDAYLTKPFEEDTLLELVVEVAEAVWQRTHGKARAERGSIRFKCRCGRRLVVLLKDRGKSTRCPDCEQRVQVPEWVGSHRAEFFTPRGPQDEELASKPDPLKYVTIKCQHCGTYYRLMPQALRHSRECPKCGEKQQGPLSIVGAPLSRAALASSRRVLIIRSGKNRGKKLLLPDNIVVIGSSPTCHIRSTSSDVSRRHCLLQATDQGLLVRDLNSQTGTFINGVRISGDVRMNPRDLLEVGKMKLQLAGDDRLAVADTPTSHDWADESEQDEDFVRAEVQQDEFQTTAEEAAHIIQLYWENARKRTEAVDEE